MYIKKVFYRIRLFFSRDIDNIDVRKQKLESIVEHLNDRKLDLLAEKSSNESKHLKRELEAIDTLLRRANKRLRKEFNNNFVITS